MTAPNGTARSVMATTDDTEATTVPMPELGEGISELCVLTLRSRRAGGVAEFPYPRDVSDVVVACQVRIPS